LPVFLRGDGSAGNCGQKSKKKARIVAGKIFLMTFIIVLPRG
jgi:hypothetical protein